MAASLLPDAMALKHWEVSRGSLAKIEGNPFAVLDDARLRRSRRLRQKASKMSTAGVGQLQEVKRKHQKLSLAYDNSYQPLYEPYIKFHDLPAEVRNMVNEVAVDRCAKHSQSSVDDDNEERWCTCAAIMEAASNGSTFDSSMTPGSLLLTSKQISQEWCGYMQKYYPISRDIQMTLVKKADSILLELGTFTKTFPVIRSTGTVIANTTDENEIEHLTCTNKYRSIVLNITCATAVEPKLDDQPEYTEKHKETTTLHTLEQDVNLEIVNSTGLEDFTNRLRLCNKLENLTINWTVQIDHD